MQTESLAVRFYSKPMQNEFLSSREGRPIHYMADFVRIEIPGNSTSIIDTFVNESHKTRFPIEWAQYLNEKTESDSIETQGTLIREWPLLTAAQATELRHFKFYTVEQIANASDSQIMSIGMAAGMAPYALRDKARAYLENAKDSALVQSQTEELRKREQEIADLKAQVERLAMVLEEQKPKRGRPAKEDEKAD
jgi:hypothetical protein